MGFASLLIPSLLIASLPIALSGCSRPAPHGLETRIATQPYLGMPPQAGGKLPPLLSQTGVFRDTATRTPNPGLIPYDINVAFWSDGADKSRWIAVPGQIVFSSAGEWRFPPGTVFVKNFDLAVDAANPGVKRRLETRLLVCDSSGGEWPGQTSDLVLPQQAGLPDLPHANRGRCARSENTPAEPAFRLPFGRHRQ